MQATVTGTLRHVEKKSDKEGKPFAICSLEQISAKGKPYFVQVCTYDLDGREMGKPATFNVNLRVNAANGARAFLNAWEVNK